MARNIFYSTIGDGDAQLGKKRSLVVELLNRRLMSEFEIGDTIVAPTDWDLDFSAYSPFPRYYVGARDLDKLFILHKEIQAFAAYENGVLTRWGPVNTGAKESPTPNGRFNFNWREPYRVSSLSPSSDEPWEMYWVLNFHQGRGIHIHQYAFPTGGPASHGCVRLIDANARWIYDWAETWQTSRGDDFNSIGSRIREQGTMVLVYFAGRCDSVADLRGKLDEFLAAAEGREAASEDRFAKGEQIAGMAYEYDLAKKYLDGPVSAAALENILGPKLEAWGYTGTVRQMVDAFMADVEEYKAAFKKEAEQVALRGMAQFETELDAVSVAMADDAAFAETFAECRDTCVAFLERTNNMGDNDYLFLELQALARGNPLLAQILDALGGNEPFGGNRSDTMGTFYEFFAMFDPDDPKAASKFKYELQKLVSKRRKGIEDSRKFIKEQDPEDFIWRTGAIQQNLQESGAKPSSIHAEIVGDELEKIADEELADALKLGAAAIAAGLLTMGTGTVAVIGATASFAISSYDAWETYSRYLQDEAGSNAGLIRTEPNFAWAVIAMVSVGPDAFEVVGVAAKVAKARRIKAIAELLDAETGDAVRAFNAANPEDLLEQI